MSFPLYGNKIFPFCTQLEIVKKRDRQANLQIKFMSQHLPNSHMFRFFYDVYLIRLSIPYRTGRFGRIYHIGQQSGMLNPPISYRKKYQPYRSISGNTSRYRKKVFFFFFLSFVIFEFLLRHNGNLFALTYYY